MSELLAIGIFGDAMSTLKVILAMCIVLGVIYLLVTIPELRPIVAVVFAVVFVFMGVSATYNNIVYLSAGNKTIGQVINSYIETSKTENEIVNNYDGSPVWDLRNLGFSHIGNNVYESTIILEPCTEIDLANDNYALFINNELCLNNEVGIDYVKSQFKYTFHNDNGNIILTDTLHINFAFNTNETKIVLRTINGLSAANLWKSFQVKNNMLLELKASDYVTPNFGNLEIVTGPSTRYEVIDDETLLGKTQVMVYMSPKFYSLLQNAWYKSSQGYTSSTGQFHKFDEMWIDCYSDIKYFLNGVENKESGYRCGTYGDIGINNSYYVLLAGIWNNNSANLQSEQEAIKQGLVNNDTMSMFFDNKTLKLSLKVYMSAYEEARQYKANNNYDYNIMNLGETLLERTMDISDLIDVDLKNKEVNIYIEY